MIEQLAIGKLRRAHLLLALLELIHIEQLAMGKLSTLELAHSAAHSALALFFAFLGRRVAAHCAARWSRIRCHTLVTVSISFAFARRGTGELCAVSRIASELKGMFGQGLITS